MILAFDAYYTKTSATLAWIEFDQWDDPKPGAVHERSFPPAADYEPGKFYKRELPLILEALKGYSLDTIACILVDGYVLLSKRGKPGLGGYLYDALEKQVPVIGVAKNEFVGHPGEEVLRGESHKPLFVTALGIPTEQAALYLKGMHGPYRMPTLFQLLDAASKGKD